jgi:YegS/Rv2252/BmrU family lipid kinase
MLVINPRSGKRRAPTAGDLARAEADRLGVELDVRTVDGPGHGTALAREAVAKGYARVVGVGGDGTNNALAAGLIGTDVALGVVPMGSGNGYARSLGLPRRPAAALRRALTAPPRRMDVGYLNDMPFLGTAGIGFDARVAHRFDRSAGRGMLGYARIIVQEVLGAPPMPVRMHMGGERIEEEVLMVVFCNTREFGNGAIISPGSRPDDGRAEVRVVRKPPVLPLVGAFIRIYTGRADRSRYIRTVTATEAEVYQQGTLAHLDGEPVEVGNHVRFRLEAGRLWVAA